MRRSHWPHTGVQRRKAWIDTALAVLVGLILAAEGVQIATSPPVPLEATVAFTTLH